MNLSIECDNREQINAESFNVLGEFKNLFTTNLHFHNPVETTDNEMGIQGPKRDAWLLDKASIVHLKQKRKKNFEPPNQNCIKKTSMTSTVE